MGRLGRGLVVSGRMAVWFAAFAALWWLSLSQLTAAQTPAPGRWTLVKMDRVVHLLSFASIVAEHYDTQGGSVDVAVDGAALDLCKGGSETIHFAWQLPQDITHFGNGDTRAVVVEAKPLHAVAPCWGGIADASSIAAVSSGSWPYDTERTQIDADRVGISGPYEAWSRGDGSRASPGINFAPWPLKTDAPFTYFQLVIGLRGAGNVAYVYMYKADTGAETMTLEPGIDRPGGDYTNADSSDALACQAACSADQMCKAFTFVNPGVQGPSGKCWLKASVPATRADPCCTSGVRR